MRARTEHRRSAVERAMAGVLGLFVLVAATACGDAESREDLAGERMVDEATSPATTPSAQPSTQPSTQPSAQPPAPAPAEAARVIPAGTLLTFEVRETVSTSSHDSGDGFTLALVNEVRGTGGAVIPAGTTARGVVTEAHASTGPEDEALLAVQVQSVALNGGQRPIAGRVESTEVESSTRDSGSRTAATIATGAAAGAVIGQILGRDTRSTVTGAAVGTVAGTAIALTTRGGDASLPEGSLITVRLDRDLTP